MGRARNPRVLLVKPPIEGLYALTTGSRHVPTGLMYLAHALRRHEIDVEIFDSLVWMGDTHIVDRDGLSPTNRSKIRTNPVFKNIIHFGATWHRLRRVVAELSPDVVGITCLFSPHYRQAYLTAELVREACPEAGILLGGPHATVAWQHVFEHSLADSVVLGEGESTLTKLILHLRGTGPGDVGSVDVSRFPGLVVRRRDGQLAANLAQGFVPDLDALGAPTLDDMDFSRYGSIASIITSRGCPFSCTFCCVHAIAGKRFRARSAESVVEELKYYVKRGVRVFNIEDDNFTFDINRADQIMEAICRAALDIELRFPNGITAVRMTGDRLRLFARAGVKQLFFGLESTDANGRSRLKKNFADLRQLAELVHVARAEGIFAFVSLIAGLPGQSREDMTSDLVEVFLRGIGASVNPYYPIPGTELHREADKLDLLVRDDLEWYEPVNFPIASQSASRSDVAAAFVLALALSQPTYAGYHQRFIVCQHPPSSREILDSLRDIGVLVSATSTDSILLAPRPCCCEEQNLAHPHSSRAAAVSAEQPCALSGALLRVILELWTRRAYAFEETQCRVQRPVERCVFRLSRIPGPPQGIVEQFLTRLQLRLQASDCDMLPEEYRGLASQARISYARFGY